MPDEPSQPDLKSPKARRLNIVLGVIGLLFLLPYIIIRMAVEFVQFNVVNYSSEPHYVEERYWSTDFSGFVSLIAFMFLYVGAVSSITAANRFRSVFFILSPLIFCAPLSYYYFSHSPPPFGFSLLAITGIGASVYLMGIHIKFPQWKWISNNVAISSIVLFIVILTLVHTFIQINFYEHFMLGHADFGHFTEELKNAWSGRGLRCDSFENTRLGWHFVPLLYVLVPGYALWPSPYYLMIMSALLVHLAVIPAYLLARMLSGSVLVGWLFAVAWLLLPSNSRLIYSNTYGFQWIYITIPLLGIMIASGVTNRWKICIGSVMLILLCKETAAAAVLGWGLYVLLFTARRKTGALMMVGSVLYFILCVKVFIPYFSALGQYERLDLFGELGQSFGDMARSIYTQPSLFVGRLIRRESIYFLLVLLVPMAWLPLLGWRICLATLPSLLLILLLENKDWLSIKFWHHATVLPVLFFAGIAAMKNINDKESKLSKWFHASTGLRKPSRENICLGMGLAALFCAAWGHYFYGFSPMSKSYEVYARAEFLHRRDPRFDTVLQLRSEIPRNKTILATERLAAHFIDYHRLYTGQRMQQADFVIIDQADHWDRSGLPQKIKLFHRDKNYQTYGEFGSIIVFQRKHDAPPIMFND